MAEGADVNAQEKDAARNAHRLMDENQSLRARLAQVDQERKAWKRWTEEAEARCARERALADELAADLWGRGARPEYTPALAHHHERRRASWEPRMPPQDGFVPDYDPDTGDVLMEPDKPLGSERREASDG